MKLLADLFITFFKVGIMTFGGGLAMLPILEREIVEKKKWISKEELLDYYAVGQCTPGIIAVNTATFIGHKLKGICGGIIATLGMVCPSFIIISLIATLLKGFSEISYVQSAFTGIRIAVCALVISTVVKLIKTNVKDVFGIIFSLTVFFLIIFIDISPIIIVLFAIILGITIKLVKERR